MYQSTDLMTVDAEYKSAVATIQVVRFHLPTPLDDVLRPGPGYRLDMCLTVRPGNSRARYVNRWAANRFERVGSVFLLREGEQVHAKSDSGEGSSVVCRLRAEPLEAWFDGELQWTDQQLQASLNISCPRIESILLRMGAEVRVPGLAHAVLLDSMSAQLAVELRRYCTTLRMKVAPGALAPWRLRLIDERLKELSHAPSLDELAGLCRLSVRQLTRGFRISRGCSIGAYITDRRIEKAKHLLLSGEPIKSVALLMGFASASSFCYVFRRATGLTPRSFRNGSSRADG